MISYGCDRCKNIFGGPLDTVNGYDLCAPCRKDLAEAKQKAEDDFYGKI